MIPFLALAGTGLSFLGKEYAAMKQSREAITEGEGIKAAAAQTAKRIRLAGRRAQGAAIADAAASGVQLGSGSAELAIQQIAQDSEADAMNTILTGDRQAAALRRGAKLNSQASDISALGSLAQGASDYYSQNGGRWKTAGRAGAS